MVFLVKGKKNGLNSLLISVIVCIIVLSTIIYSHSQMKCFYWEKPLSVWEVGFKIERGWLIVKYRYVLTDTVILDSWKILVKRKISHIQQKFQREKLKVVFQILHDSFPPKNFKECIYFGFIIPRFNRMWTEFIINMKLIDFKKYGKTFFKSSASPLNYSSLCTF